MFMRFYSMMISSGMISKVIFMYSYLINGVPNYKLFMSQHIYLAPGVEMVLLMMSFDVVIYTVGVLTSLI